MFFMSIFIFVFYTQMYTCKYVIVLIFVIARTGVKFCDKIPLASDEGKIAILSTTREIYPKFRSYPCYYIHYTNIIQV